MGKQAPGKKLPGLRNGYGGKCEEGEEYIDCAVRELEEESRVKVPLEKLINVGKIIDVGREVEFYVVNSEEKFDPPRDNSEFVDVRWFDISKREEYIFEMFPGNEGMIIMLEEKLKELNVTKKIEKTFVFDQSKIDLQEKEELYKKMYSTNN